jgi:hypothetical protein
MANMVDIVTNGMELVRLKVKLSPLSIRGLIFRAFGLANTLSIRIRATGPPIARILLGFQFIGDNLRARVMNKDTELVSHENCCVLKLTKGEVVMQAKLGQRVPLSAEEEKLLDNIVVGIWY